MTNNILSNVMIFVAGAAVGAVVTWKLLDEKYKNMVKEETDTLREIYSKEDPEETEEEETKESENSEENDEEEQRSMYKQMVAKSGYTNYNKTKREEEVDDVEKPYLITPDEFGELDGYNTVTLWCYSDGTVVDDQDNMIDNYERIIGKDFINHFGDYENDADSVFVRNDRLRSDYEILRDVGVYEGPNR